MARCVACGYDPNIEVENAYTIVLHCKAPSQNDLKANTRYSYRYRGIRRQFVGLLTDSADEIPSAKGHRRTFITRQYGKRQRDYDYGNLVGGLKPLLDALTHHKLLIDDSPKWLTDYYYQEKSADGRDHIVIVLEDVDKT